MIVEKNAPHKEPRRGDMIWVWSFLRLIFETLNSFLDPICNLEIRGFLP